MILSSMSSTASRLSSRFAVELVELPDLARREVGRVIPEPLGLVGDVLLVEGGVRGASVSSITAVVPLGRVGRRVGRARGHEEEEGLRPAAFVVMKSTARLASRSVWYSVGWEMTPLSLMK